MESSLIIKVQYGETLRRFSSRVVDGKLDLDMNALRKKVSSLFSFPAGSDLDLTYVDEDGDVVKLADEEDLHDIMRQFLDPLRITVRLTAEGSVSLRPHSRSSGNSTPVRSPQLQIPLQVGNTSVSEVLNSLPATIRETVSKFSTESGFESNSPAEYLVILDSLAKMGLTYLKEVSIAGAKSGPPESSTDAPVAKDKNSSISVGNTPVTKSRPPESSTDAPVTKDKNRSISVWTTPVTKVKNSSINVGTSQISELRIMDTYEGNAVGNSEGFIMPAKDNANTKDKSSIMLNKAALNSCNDLKRHNDIASQGNVGKNGRSGPKMKLVKKSFGSHPGWNSIMASKPLTRIDSPSSGLPVPPYMHRHQLPYRAAPVKRSYNHSDVMGSVFHTGIQCDGCGVHPISGPRFKSKVKEDYDLCIHCFNYMGIEAEYIRMDLPMNYQNPDPLNFCYPQRLGRSPTLPADHAKLDNCFILDVNFVDGTVMAPLTQFTKIWRMRNNGASAWPHGTNLLWIGGDKLSKTHSCDLKIPAEGCPVGKEIDIAVDCTAPENPGRYISYWRMASPSGLKFGQRVWVLIQVDSSLKGSDSKNPHDFNLNLPPVSSGIMGLQNVNASVDPNTGDDLIQNDTLTKDQNASIDPNTGDDLIQNDTLTKDQNASIDPKIGDDLIKIDTPTVDQGLDLPNNGTVLLAVAKPNSITPEASSPVTYPIVDQSKVEPVAIPGQQNSVTDVPFSMIDVDQVADEVEQTLLKELESMGFTEVDLNKEILRKNEYDLEEALNELCDTEWDPMLAELQEMGFSNNEMNKMLLKKNNGSIKRVVMDLIAGEEDE